MKRMRTRECLLFIIIICMLGVPVSGLSSEYRLGVGDVLQISVWGHTELATTVEVRPDGYITFPLVGDVWAVEKTARMLSNEIQAALEDYVVEPRVTVIVSKFRTLQVQVLGEVASPGYYELKASSRLMDVLGAAGGPTKEADLANVTITRYVLDPDANPEQALVESVNVNDFITAGVMEANPVLQSGDVIYVSSAGKALILGDVRQPAGYDTAKGMDVLDLLALAGGALETADLERVVLTRQENGKSLEYVINVQAFLSGQSKETIEIRPHDVVFVPGKQQVIVLGAVNSPGTYVLRKGARLVDIIAAAGGVRSTSDSTRISITRTAGDEQEIFVVDAFQSLTGKEGGENPLLFGNDIVFVPEGRNHALVLGQVHQPGSYILSESTRVLDIIAEAGGLTAAAAVDRVTLTRETEQGVQVYTLNIGEMQEKGVGHDTLIAPGDVLFVPEGAPQVLVLGQVSEPGSYRVHGTTRLLDVIALAGGPLERAGETLLLTRDGKTAEIDLGALSRLGLNNRLVHAGDVIYIPEGQKQVLVLGEVRSPGYYQFRHGDKILDAIGYAGGLLESAQEDQVTVTRQTEQGTEITSLDIAQLMENRFLENNRPLKGGDIIIVPKSDRSVLVLGEVQNPGYYTLSKGQRVLDLIAMAGGLTNEGQAATVRLTRRLENEEEAHYVLDLDKAMRGLGGENPLIQGGDVLFVPERQTRVLVFGEVRSPGYYPITASTRVLDAVGQAGGFTEAADAAQVQFTYETEDGTQTDILDLQKSMETGLDNTRLQGGEMILVPRSNRTVLVFGEVVKPGTYTILPGERIMDVLAKAGGPGVNADLTQVRYTKAAEGTGEGRTLDLTKAFVDSSHDSNLALAGGEMLYVPQGNRRVLVLGQVNRPGAFSCDDHTRLLDVLALAGGPTSLADLGQATLTRTVDGQETVINLNIAEILANQEENPILAGGDVIYLPQAKQVVVMGEVTRPGAYTLPTGGRIIDVLALAGGLRSNFEAQNVVMTRHEHDGERIWHMTYEELMNNQTENNLLMVGGDVLYVPESRRQVLVLGEVKNPGVYNIPVGARVMDALALAGGPTERAALENVGIYRDGTVDAPSTLTMGKDKLLFAGDVQENPLIAGGDVIYVPETKKPNWTKIFGFVGGLKTFQELIKNW